MVYRVVEEREIARSFYQTRFAVVINYGSRYVDVCPSLRCFIEVSNGFSRNDVENAGGRRQEYST